MSTIAVLVLSAFVIGAAVGALLMFMYRSATLEQAKQRFADELHRVVEREEQAKRATAQFRHVA